MIKITNKSLYALKFLINLTEVNPHGHLSVADIASRENISEKFLELIVSQLKSNNLIKAKRGAGGGYMLNKNPANITMLDVIKAVESDASSNEETEMLDSTTGYIIQEKLQQLDRQIKNYLNGITLSSLYDDYLLQQSGQMFYI